MTPYGIDPDGFIITEVHRDKIKPAHSEILKDVTVKIISSLSPLIHSIYLYGSTASGTAQLKSSDLDLLLITKTQITEVLKTEIEQIQKSLTFTYINEFRDVGISVTYLNEVKQDPYGWGCFIKYLCLFNYGSNLQDELPRYKPSKKIALAFNGDINTHIEFSLKEITLNKSNPDKTRNICRAIMRKIIRTGFSLVMEEEQSWTTDLQQSCDVFSRYYPEYSNNMETALSLSKNPEISGKDLTQFLTSFGLWIQNEVMEKLK